MKRELLKTKGYKISEKEITALMKSATGRIKASKLLIESDSFRDSVSRSYYGILDATRALLLHSGYFAKTHSGVLSLFSQKFIKEEKIAVEYKSIFKRAKDFRENADYSALVKFTKNQAEEIYEGANKFVKMVEAELKKGKNLKTLKAILL